MKKRSGIRSLHTTEVMTILVNFHQSQYRNFKHYYQKHVAVYLRWTFPCLISYNRFVELMSETFLPLSVYENPGRVLSLQGSSEHVNKTVVGLWRRDAEKVDAHWVGHWLVKKSVSTWTYAPPEFRQLSSQMHCLPWLLTLCRRRNHHWICEYLMKLRTYRLA